MKRPVRRCRRNKKNDCVIKKVIAPLEEAREALKETDFGKHPELKESKAAILNQIENALWLTESSLWMEESKRDGDIT